MSLQVPWRMLTCSGGIAAAALALGPTSCTQSYDNFSFGPTTTTAGGSQTGTQTGTQSGTPTATGGGGTATGTGTAGSGGSSGEGGGTGATGGSGGSPAECGNGGPPEPGEQCDDGNTDPGDRCGPDCDIEYPDVCPGTPIDLGSTAIVIQDDTQGADDTVSQIAGTGPCFPGDYPGIDLIYEVTPSTSGTVTITFDPDFGDHVLHARSACPGVTSDELDCDYSSNSGTDDVITVDATAGTPFYVFADSWDNSSGTFTLTITPP